MLHYHTAAGAAVAIDGNGHIVIALDGDGKASVTTYFDGALDTTCCHANAYMLKRSLSFLLREMREQIKLGRRLTADESREIYEQMEAMQ